MNDLNQVNVFTPQSSSGIESGSRPKSQAAATGLNARIKRNSHLVNSSAMQILRHQSGNNLGAAGFELQPSDVSIIESNNQKGQIVIRTDRAKL